MTAATTQTTTLPGSLAHSAERASSRGDAQRAAHAAFASIADACAYAGVGRSTMYARAAAGQVRLVKIGARTLVDGIASEAVGAPAEGIVAPGQALARHKMYAQVSAQTDVDKIVKFFRRLDR